MSRHEKEIDGGGSRLERERRIELVGHSRRPGPYQLKERPGRCRLVERETAAVVVVVAAVVRVAQN